MDALRTEVYAFFSFFLRSQKAAGIFVKQAAHVYFPVALRGVKQSKSSRFNLLCHTLQGANLSLLGKGKLIFKNTLVGYMLVARRVFVLHLIVLQLPTFGFHIQIMEISALESCDLCG